MSLYRVLAAELAEYFFFFNDTATTEIYTLSLHDALPISSPRTSSPTSTSGSSTGGSRSRRRTRSRSEEHTSELQSLAYIVCRLLLEKKKREDGPPAPRARSRVRSCSRRSALPAARTWDGY